MFRAFIALACIILLSIVSLFFATADTMTPEIDREDLKVVRLSIKGANIYLVERSGKRLMIDSGNPGDQARIEAFMRQADFPPESVDYLILTHGHLDHLGTARHFQDRYGVKIIGGLGDAGMFSTGEQQPLCSIGALAVAIDAASQGKTYPLFAADILVDAPYDLQQLGIAGQLLPMPGHTEGALLAIFDQAVFVGDLIRGEVFRQEQPTRHFFMCDLPDNDRDIEQVLQMKQLTRWYPGHFGPLNAEDVQASLSAGL